MNHKISRAAVLELIERQVERNEQLDPEEQSRTLSRLLAMAWEARRPSPATT